jgi:hypothetical protein
MWRLLVLALMLFGFAADPALGCSFAAGYREFAAGSDTPPAADAAVVTPRMYVDELRRGYDDGNFASCSDAGILTIVIQDGAAAQDLGFDFILESGAFPDAVLPERIVSPIELGDGLWGFSFVWLDLPAGKAEVDPIDVRIAVRAVSIRQQWGEKVFLDVQDP